MIELFVVIFGVAFVIGIIVQCVRSAFGPQYVKCDCGNKCRVSSDGCFYWECDKCGQCGNIRSVWG